MKLVKVLLIIIMVNFIIGCAGLLNQGLEASHGGTKIYKGQSADSVERALGSPDIISSGILCKNTPFGFLTTRNTIEWVYIGSTCSTIIYLSRGMVTHVFQNDTNKIRR
uniref:Lipoprotein n=1 Tax=viral metagenome TaxID=1070528 RepID=A0A6M3IFF6_9ZZZZ